MNEMIIRINDNNPDVEISYKKYEDFPKFKKIEKNKFLELLNNEFSKNVQHKKNLKLLDPSIIAMDEYYVLVNQPGHKKIVVYLNDRKQAKTYKINFPNSLYIIERNKSIVRSIECYSYKTFQSEKTELYQYPMPNELTGNKMCIGTADRKIINNNIIEALERIIFTPYSHSTFSGMNGFSKTETYFEYLEKNEFPYKMMKPLKKKLLDVLSD